MGLCGKTVRANTLLNVRSHSLICLCFVQQCLLLHQIGLGRCVTIVDDGDDLLGSVDGNTGEEGLSRDTALALVGLLDFKGSRLVAV